MVGAVSFKHPSDDEFPGKELMLECSLNIAGAGFQREMEDMGLLPALRSGRFTSFAFDLGPAWADYTEGRSAGGYPRYLPVSGQLDMDEYLAGAQRNFEYLRRSFSGPR